jgi:hypothetical protein
LVDQISQILRGALAPSVRTVVCPVGIGGNPNHSQTAAALARVAAGRGIDTVWCADYPYAALPQWPGWIDGHGTMPPHWGEMLSVAGDNIECTVVLLDEDLQGAKAASFAGYASQVDATDRGGERAVTDPSRIRAEVYFARPGLLA